MKPVTKSRPAPKTAKQRQAAHRARRRADGYKFFSVALNGPTADALQALALAHNRTLGEVVALGVLLARRALQAAP
jgi:hypothetical protein